MYQPLIYLKEVRQIIPAGKFTKSGRMKGVASCITVLKTKHEKKLMDGHYSQVLGYYCGSKSPNDKTGITIILNEYKPLLFYFSICSSR